jgi:membrane carboxypeptidase/penicillin-binding protein PbpC
MAIGNPEVTLQQLTAGFAMLANGGKYRNLKYLLNEKFAVEKYIFSSQAAYIITDILADPSARMLTFDNNKFKFPFKIAIKTGTSTKQRDGWAMGYTPEYTIGVWIGNFDGKPTYNLSGAEGAMPIFYDVVNLLYRKSYPEEFKMPEGIIISPTCSYSGMKPAKYCRHLKKELFLAGVEPDPCIFHNDARETHYLPAAYANWVYNKKESGTLGNYRIKGFHKDLNEIFQNPWESVKSDNEEEIIHVRGNSKAQIRKIKKMKFLKTFIILLEAKQLKRISFCLTLKMNYR